jgi:transposase
MKKAEKRKPYDAMRSEYDFTEGVRGNYAQRYAAGSNVVVLDPDVARMFPTACSVNSTLRTLVEIAERRIRRTSVR